MDIYIDGPTGRTVARLSEKEVAEVINQSLRKGTRPPWEPMPAIIETLSQAVSECFAQDDKLQIEIVLKDAPKEESPQDPVKEWATRKALATQNTYHELYKLRAAAETDKRADYLLSLQDSTGTHWAQYLDAIKCIPPVNPPGIFPPPGKVAHGSHLVDSEMGNCVKCGARTETGLALPCPHE